MDKSIKELIRDYNTQGIINDTTYNINHTYYTSEIFYNIPFLYIHDDTIETVSIPCRYDFIGKYSCHYNHDGLKFLFIYDKNGRYIHPIDYEYILRCDNNEDITTEIISEKGKVMEYDYYKIKFSKSERSCGSKLYTMFMVDDILVTVFFDVYWRTFKSIFIDIHEYAKRKILNEQESLINISQLLSHTLEYIVSKMNLPSHKLFIDKAINKCKKNSIISLNDYIIPIYEYIDRWVYKNKKTIDVIISSTISIGSYIKFIKIQCYSKNGYPTSNKSDNIHVDTIRINITFDISLKNNQVKDIFIKNRREIYNHIRLQLGVRGIDYKNLKIKDVVIQSDGCIELIYLR